MADPPPAKKPRVSSSEIHLTEAEQKVVKIQFEKNNRSPKTPPWNALLEEYRRFLQIKLSDPSAPFAPSYIMDQMWHAHILSTRHYLAFCERHNDGVYVHHDPTMKRGQPRYNETLEAYQKIFKEKPGHPDIWPQHVGQKPKGRAAAVKKEEETESNKSDHVDQEQSRRAVASAKKEEETESDEDNRPNQKPRAFVVVKKEEEQGADSADQEPRAAVATKREQDTERTDNEDRKPTDAKIKKEEERERESGENDRARMATLDPNVTASAKSARSQNARSDEEDDEDEGPADCASYDTDEREYLEEYGSDRGETLEELQEWHREAILDPANNEGFDPRVCLTTCNCMDGHRWYDGEFLLNCASCRQSSVELGAFSCG